MPVCWDHEQRGRCKYGSACKFEHANTGQEFKTAAEIGMPLGMCHQWFRTGSCRFGRDCRFAHNEVKSLDERQEDMASMPSLQSLQALTQPKKRGNPDHFNLFVDNVCPRMTDEEFIELFSPFGTVMEGRVFTHTYKRMRARQGAFGFIEFKTLEEAEAATKALDETFHRGFTMTVRQSDPELDDNRCSVYVANIPSHFDIDDVKKLFSKCGQVLNARLLPPRAGSDSLYEGEVGFVRFAFEDDARKAVLTMDDTLIEGADCTLTVRFARSADKKDRAADGMKNMKKRAGDSVVYRPNDPIHGPEPVGGYNKRLGNGNDGWGQKWVDTKSGDRKRYDPYLKNQHEGDGQKACVYVIGFPQHWTEETIEELFYVFGPINKIYFKQDTAENIDRQNRNRGIAFVHFKYQKDAEEAIRLTDGTAPHDAADPLNVRFARTALAAQEGLPEWDGMIALEDYEPTEDQPDMLAVHRGEKLLILSQTDDAWWYCANLKADKGYVPKTYITLHPSAKGVTSKQPSEHFEYLDPNGIPIKVPEGAKIEEDPVTGQKYLVYVEEETEIDPYDVSNPFDAQGFHGNAPNTKPKRPGNERQIADLPWLKVNAARFSAS